MADRTLIQLWDHLVLACVGLWMRLSAPSEWARLAVLQGRFGVFGLHLAVPRLANEKYLWRKLLDHNPLFITQTDKEACKQWVTARGFDVTQPKTLWRGADAHDIPDGVWATPMVIKATHGCQMNVMVPQEPADRAAVVTQANAFLSRDHGGRRRQWAYGEVVPQLIAEEWVFPGKDLIEYKCYAYGDTVTQLVAIYRGAQPSAAIWEASAGGAFFVTDQMTAVADRINRAPLGDAANRAIALSAEIGRSTDHVRVDWLSDGNELMLGEVTVYNLAGRAHLQGHFADAPLNRAWDLRRSWFLRTPQAGWQGLYAASLQRRLSVKSG